MVQTTNSVTWEVLTDRPNQVILITHGELLDMQHFPHVLPIKPVWRDIQYNLSVEKSKQYP